MKLITKRQYIAFYTLTHREVSRVLRIWPQSLLPFIVTSVLYFMIFGKLIGARVGSMSGINYLHFIAPGLVMLGAINNAFSNVSFSFFSAKFTRSLQEILVSILAPQWIMMGYVMGGVFRGVIVGIIVTIIAWLFGEAWPLHQLFCLLIVILSTLLFSMLGLINGLFANKFDDVAIIPTFVLTPLTYLGGVFYSIDLLPPFWHVLSRLNPILYIINLLRYGFYETISVSVWVSLAALIAANGAAIGVAYWCLKRGWGIRT